MPYIKKDGRTKFEWALQDVERRFWSDDPSPGDLNYLFTRLAHAYMGAKGKKYAVINDIIGALEAAKLEFYRRVAAPYEDTKITENGDVP